MPPTSVLTFHIAAATRAASVVALATLGSSSVAQTSNNDSDNRTANNDHAMWTTASRHSDSDSSSRSSVSSNSSTMSGPILPHHPPTSSSTLQGVLGGRKMTSCESWSNSTTINSNTNSTDLSSNSLKDEEQRFRVTLEHHRSLLNTYKEDWDYVGNVSSRIPTISWPSHPKSLPFPPSTTPLSTLQPELDYCYKSPNYRDDSNYCSAIAFQIAFSILTFGSSGKDDESSHLQQAWTLLKESAEAGHADSMCFYAQLVNNGHSGLQLEPNPKNAVAWLHHCVSLHPQHAQSLYELGVAYFTGEGVAEDEPMAATYFRLAADCNSSDDNDIGHPGAAYMLGDCLLDGIGVPRDRSQALYWLIQAGQWGHRGARSRVLAVLEHVEGQDYGSFTDASRQSLQPQEDARQASTTSTVVVVETLTVPKDNDDDDDDILLDLEDEEDEERRHWEAARENVLLHERKFTVGGVSSAKLLARRKTMVAASRDEQTTPSTDTTLG